MTSRMISICAFTAFAILAASAFAEDVSGRDQATVFTVIYLSDMSNRAEKAYIKAMATKGKVKALQEDLNSDLVLSRKLRARGIANLQDAEFVNDWPNNMWRMALESEDVFLSHPIDIDFSMLHAFPEWYRIPNPGGYGPTTQPADIAGKKATTLKKHGKPQLYGAEHDLTFAWYPYLFLSNSKPETHISALARIPDAILAAQAPPEIRALVAVIAKALRLNGGAQ